MAQLLTGGSVRDLHDNVDDVVRVDVAAQPRLELLAADLGIGGPSRAGQRVGTVATTGRGRLLTGPEQVAGRRGLQGGDEPDPGEVVAAGLVVALHLTRGDILNAGHLGHQVGGPGGADGVAGEAGAGLTGSSVGQGGQH